jgi:hypothetical protein
MEIDDARVSFGFGGGKMGERDLDIYPFRSEDSFVVGCVRDCGLHVVVGVYACRLCLRRRRCRDIRPLFSGPIQIFLSFNPRIPILAPVSCVCVCVCVL